MGWRTVQYFAVMPGTAETMEVVIETVPSYVKLGPKFKELHEQHVSVQELAKIHGISKQYAQGILDFGLTGKLPKWVAPKSVKQKKSR